MKRIRLAEIGRALVFVAILVGLAVYYRTSGWSQYFAADRLTSTIESIRDVLAAKGVAGWFAFILIGALAMVANLPTLGIVFVAVLVFGKLVGALLSFVIVAVGTAAIYYIAQSLARPLVARLMQSRMKRMDEHLRERGLMTVFLLRLIFCMGPVLNWSLSLTGVRFRDYFLGTLMGIVHTLALATWLSGMVVERLQKGETLNVVKAPILAVPVLAALIIGLVARYLERRRIRRRLQDTSSPPVDVSLPAEQSFGSKAGGSRPESL